MTQRAHRSLPVRVVLAALALTVVGLVGTSATAPAGAAPGDVTVFADPEERLSGNLQGITTGPDGNVWFTDRSAELVGRISGNGTIDTFEGVDEELDGASRITTGPDGNLWFTNEGSNRIGRITPAGVITTNTAPGIDLPVGITAGPDGNVWFANEAGDNIGRITPQGVTLFDDPADQVDAPWEITSGADGNLWFTSLNNARIGRITPDGDITTFSDPQGNVQLPSGIAAGPDGNVWFTNELDGRIGRITPAGAITTFAAPPAEHGGGFGITAAADGNLWFTSSTTGRIGRITPSGTITTFPAGVDAPYAITAGPDGDVWYTGRSQETGEGVIARLTVCSAPFTDVGVDQPFRDDICWMSGQGISTGYDDGTYRPSVAVSRQAMSAFMYRLAGQPNFKLPPSPTFSDVSPTNPFYADVEFMAAFAISTGYQDGTYRPSAAVSRQAMSAFMYRLAGEPAFSSPGSATFSDVGVGHPFFAEVEWMADEAITTGFDDGTYRPSTAVSRQAMSAFMRRLAGGPGVDIPSVD